MKILLNIIFTNLIFFAAFNCNENIYSPPEDQPGRRDYEWTVDTINQYTTRMWGNSASDLWIISPPGDFSKSIYHFDGNKWTTDGIFRFFSPHSIWGFDKNNIYIGGADGKIWHFNGSGWQEIAVLTKDGNDDVVFDNMWGESPYDFYAFGAYPDEEGYATNSIIAHYYNGKWEMLSTNGLFGIVEHFYKNKSDKKIYLQVIGGHNYTDSTHIYEYKKGNYIKLYSNLWRQGLQADISLINTEVYFCLGSEIAKRVHNQFQTLLKVNNPNFYQKIWGRNIKDIFLMMVDGLAHYNGSDIEYLFHFSLRTQIAGAALFEKDVFFLVYESQSGLSLIYHGKLKEE